MNVPALAGILSPHLLLGFADEHYVGFPVAANHRQLPAVERAVEVSDELRLEIGELGFQGTPGNPALQGHGNCCNQGRNE